MLLQLNITDFAIIKHLEISPSPGLNILSGETGTGKSIIINAMNLILGKRASADLIRTGCENATVEALFNISNNGFVSSILSEFGISFDDELLIKRTLYREGRNRISINGTIATLQMLSRLGPHLISISGQHEHQILLRPDNHLYLLDDYSGLAKEREKFRVMFDNYRLLEGEIDDLEAEIRRIAMTQELASFQVREIENANIIPYEDERLLEEKKRLQHSEELLEILLETYNVLYERDGSLFSLLSQCAKGMDRAADMDKRLTAIRDELTEIELRTEDISLSLRDIQKSIQMDPGRLEEVTERLDLLNRLKQKFGPSLEDVLKTKEKLASEIYDLEDKRGQADKLRRQLEKLGLEMIKTALYLSKKRKKAAAEFEEKVEDELRRLHMGETRFQVRFREELNKENVQVDSLSVDGLDQVEFMISPNVGEELRPLHKIASGGELSRIILAIKTILAQSGSVETIIFDEVDSGISGATAEVVGEKLLSLAGYHQLVCITHLPQIASKGNTHFLVKKEVSGGRTQTLVLELDKDERVKEIARLLGGREITDQGMAHAREMLE